MDDALWIDIGIAAAAALGGLSIGLLIGWRHRTRTEADGDWKLRLAARDQDLADAMGRLVDAEMAYQAAMEQMSAMPATDSESLARIEALTEELADAEDELTRLQVLGVDRTPAGGNLARRLETLEAELANLQSLRCPEPAAHRRSEERGIGRDRPQSAASGR